MSVHVVNHAPQCVWLNNGIGVEQKQVASLGCFHTDIIAFSITQILLAGNQAHLGKTVADHLRAAIARGAVDDDDFKRQVGRCLASRQQGLEASVQQLFDIPVDYND